MGKTMRWVSSKDVLKKICPSNSRDLTVSLSQKHVQPLRADTRDTVGNWIRVRLEADIL